MNDNLNLEDILVDRSAEGDLMEVPLTKKVFQAFFFVVAIMVAIVLFRFLAVAVGDHFIYSKTASANIMQTDLERAPRGVIKDRFDEPLVSNEQDFKVFISPSKFPKEGAKRQEVLANVSSVLNKDYSDLRRKIGDHDWTLGRPLIAERITHNKLVQLTSEDIPGVDVEPGFKRVHRTSYTFSHVLGYTGLVTKEDVEERPELTLESLVGKDGLEKEYDKWLRGTPGEVVSYVDAKGNIKEEKTVKQPEPGKDLDTFIDSDLQRYFYTRLRMQLNSIGSTAGVGLAINPQNGEVLSLVSMPSYSNENVGGSLKRSDKPLFNRAVNGLYNPGSTIKPLVALAALEEGVVSPDRQFYSPGYLKVENPYFEDKPSIFKDWMRHGWVDMREALARSSNVYFYLAGGGHERDELYGLNQNMSGLGIENLKKWWNKFRLDEKTFIDIPGENSAVLPDPEWKQENLDASWRVGDTYNVSIGQGNLRVTPVQLLSYISAIANGGKVNQLRVADKGGEIVLSDISGEFSEDNLEVVREGMVDAVEKPYGTAYNLHDLPIEVAAKTGSAQTGNQSVNAFFVGYAPVDDPEIAVLVLIEDASEGSLNAVPVARDVLMWYHNNRIIN